MPNGTYGGVRGKETKVGQKTFVSRPTRLSYKQLNAEIIIKQVGAHCCIKVICPGKMTHFFNYKW